MYKIQRLNKIAGKGLEILSQDDYEIASEFRSPDAILVRSAKMHDMEIPDTVKAIARAGAGVNNIPVDACTERGIVVFNTPGANANGVKELALTAMLLSSRGVYDGITWAQGLIGKGDEVPKLIEKGKSQFAGPELAGKTLGVIGLGAIGVMVANAAEALGMKVIGYDPFISVEAAWGLSHTVHRAVGLDSLLSEVDYISLHLPLNDNTRGMINRDKLAMTRKGVRLINLARGGLVNNEHLIEAIEKGTVAAYVTDFPDEELLKTDKVIPMPHLGASTFEAEENCAVMAVRQLKEYLEKGHIKNSVNFPECELALSGKTRLLIANKNVPAMVGKITTILADQGVNIADMINKHKKEIAYNIIDVDAHVDEEQVERMRKIPGVISVRLLENMVQA